MNKKIIPLRVIGFVRNGEFQLICLDTDIAVVAQSPEEGKSKMKDALTSYFKTFSKDEIKEGLFLRRAPFRYFMLWHVLSVVSIAVQFVYFFSSTANYDQDTHTLKLA
jgi:hypothetical protein